MANGQSLMGLITSQGASKRNEDGLIGKEAPKASSRRAVQSNVDVTVVKSKEGPVDHALDVLMTTERFRNLKVHKNQLTIAP